MYSKKGIKYKRQVAGCAESPRNWKDWEREREKGGMGGREETYIADIGKSIKDNEDDLAILGTKQVTQWLQTVVFQAVTHLGYTATWRQVRDCPHSFLLTLEITLKTVKIKINIKSYICYESWSTDSSNISQ